MILGHVHIDGNAVVTHRDSYLIDQLSVVSVRRPFLATGLVATAGIGGFVLAFGDLLYPVEIGVLAVIAVVAPLAAAEIGRLKLLSRDLRGSELAGVVWGRYATLNAVRAEIVASLVRRRGGGA